MAYKETYEIEVHHKGLNKYRHIKGSDEYVVRQKALNQKLIWNEMWEKKLTSDRKKKEKELAAINKEKKKALAQERTKEAVEEIEKLNNILLHTVN